jgi:cell surface protein SprA
VVAIQDFEMFALDYDNDRNFFYRNILETSMMRPKKLSFVDRVQITRLEVWVTNKQTRVNTNSNNLRNIIALQDLGEAYIQTNEVVVQIHRQVF